MSVIRALSATDSNEQREDEKLKLEKNFKKSDKKLGDLIERHESDLVEVSNFVCNLITFWNLFAYFQNGYDSKFVFKITLNVRLRWWIFSMWSQILWRRLVSI